MNLMARLESDLVRIIGRTATPKRPDPLPVPECNEYVGVDEIQTGNSDLPAPEWTGRTEPEERAPLPGHEHQLRPVSSAHLQAWVDAQLARVDSDFGALDAYARSIHGRMYRDGLLPDRRKEVRS